MESKQCNKCGTSNPSDFMFCKSCGQELNTTNAKTTPQSTVGPDTDEISKNKNLKRSTSNESNSQNISEIIYKYISENPTPDKIPSVVSQVKEADAYLQALFLLKSDYKIKYKLAHSLLIKALDSKQLSKKEEYEAYKALSDICAFDNDMFDPDKSISYAKEAISIADILELDYDENLELAGRKQALWLLFNELFINKSIENDDWVRAFEYCNEAITYTDHPAAHLKIADIYILRKKDVDSARKHLEYIIAQAEYFGTVFKGYDEIAKKANHTINELSSVKIPSASEAKDVPVASKSKSEGSDEPVTLSTEPKIEKEVKPEKVTPNIPEGLTNPATPASDEPKLSGTLLSGIPAKAVMIILLLSVFLIVGYFVVQNTTNKKNNDLMSKEGTQSNATIEKQSIPEINKENKKEELHPSNQEKNAIVIDLDEAIAAYNNSEYDVAIKLCRSVLRREPNNALAKEYLQKAIDDQETAVNNAFGGSQVDVKKVK